MANRLAPDVDGRLQGLLNRDIGHNQASGIDADLTGKVHLPPHTPTPTPPHTITQTPHRRPPPRPHNTPHPTASTLRPLKTPPPPLIPSYHGNAHPKQSAAGGPYMGKDQDYIIHIRKYCQGRRINHHATPPPTPLGAVATLLISQPLGRARSHHTQPLLPRTIQAPKVSPLLPGNSPTGKDSSAAITPKAVRQADHSSLCFPGPDGSR